MVPDGAPSFGDNYVTNSTDPVAREERRSGDDRPGAAAFANGAATGTAEAQDPGDPGSGGPDPDEPEQDSSEDVAGDEFDDQLDGDGDPEQTTRSDDDENAAPSESDLFRQSEIAADYIEGLLDILDFDGDIDELVQAGRPVVEVVGARLNNLVGIRGATLEALQELTRLAVYRQTGEPSRLLLDVGGFRATRRKELVAVAKNAAEKVKRHGEIVRLEPMSAFERKCVHDVINAMAGVESQSEGVEPSRRIVIRPVGD
jgi:spoIIIJ-associated protein